MQNVNLIPAPRRQARRRRVLIRRCAIGCAGYALLLAGVGAGALSAWGGGDPVASEQLGRLDQEIQRNEHLLADARGELSARESELAAESQIADQPNWSVLFSLLASKAQDQIILRSLQLKPAPDSGENSPPARLIVSAGGVSRSPLAAQQYVLRLEKTGLFNRVTLVETHRESFLTSDAAAFQIECVLSPAGNAKENP